MNVTKIGNVIKVASGGTPSRKNPGYYENGTIPWVKTGDLKNKFIEYASESITEAALQASSAKVFPPGTILLAMYGATIGACSILKLEAATNQACAALLPSEDVNSEYLFYFLLSIRNELISMGAGGAQPNISATIVKNIQIPLPPLPVQQKIAAILDAADLHRRKTKTLIEKYDQLTQSIFLEMFGGISGNSTTLGEVCEINPKKSEIAHLSNETLISFIPMSNISEQGEVDLSQNRTIKEVWNGFTYFKENDVAFAKITPCMENGKGGIMRDLSNGIGFGTTEFHILRPIKNISTPEWIYYLTASKHFRSLAESNMTGSAGQKRVPKAFLENFKVDCPSFDQQEKFALRIKLIQEQKAKTKIALEKAEDLFNTLLQRAFKGELVN
jgi:type I restriction enzyme, S subunit